MKGLQNVEKSTFRKIAHFKILFLEILELIYSEVWVNFYKFVLGNIRCDSS